MWCSLAQGFPYLVITLEIKRVGKTERRQLTEGIITSLIAYRQLPTLKAKTPKLSTL